MKSPAELAARLARQWQVADRREKYLLFPHAWPWSLPIGKPDAALFTRYTDQVRDHVQHWRGVTVGRVIWQSISFRSGSEPVDVPVNWVLRTPSEWVAATGDTSIEQEYHRLGQLVAAVDPRFHRLLVRQRHLLQDMPEAEIIRAAEVALALSPGYAAGRPLRALSVAGIDSKFLERHRSLVIQLLDVRFDGAVSNLGLEPFLDALEDNAHWLLVAPLTTGLLPFTQQRIRASELFSVPLPSSHILIVENERCLQQLPRLPGTIAILGAGLNLRWMQTDVLQEKVIGYWGDMDTWGLQMLAIARSYQPNLTPLLMTRDLFATYASTLAVSEASPADKQPPEPLTASEQDFYRYLHMLEKGRLEQEFLPKHLVLDALIGWRQCSVDP